MEIIKDKWLYNFVKELQNTQDLKIISPFIGDNMVAHLLKNWTGNNIQVITRFNLNDFRSGVSSLNALKKLVSYGAEIKGVKGLHSKAYLFDQKSTIITSANFTNGGFFNNHELGIQTDDQQHVFETQNYFEKLWKLDNYILDIQEIDKWQTEIDSNKIKVVGTNLMDYGISPIKKVVGSKNYFIKFYGKGNNRASWDKDVIDEVTRAHCHFAVTFPTGLGRPIRYNEGDVVYMARMIHNEEYAIFGRAIARKHNRLRDVASPEDIAKIDWKVDYPIYIRVHSGEFLNTTFGNCPKMGALMTELGYECFKGTKNSYKRGKENINPRLSLMRKPDIWLSEEGAYWVEQKFQHAKKIYNLIDQSYIDSLYQGTPLIV
ncbi:phospholipase D family protein [Flavobacterium psychrotrophum]|uniref:phospholipase D family protein n=1 Tax=Flavobacterium psychrotrophum TaxID=2294119 RepID=UPI0013C44C99|nr:phospholipase D family protein [Flavobacterium psychrotrophum]